MIRRAIILAVMIIGVSGIECNTARSDELDDLLSGFESDKEEEKKGLTELDQLLDGFDEKQSEAGEQAADDETAILPKWFELQGGISLRSTSNFAHDEPSSGDPDYRGLSMFRVHGELIGEVSISDWKARVGVTAFYDAAYQFNNQRDYYTDTYLDEYEKEIELNEAYIQGKLTDNLDLRFGRQIVVWGKSDNIRVTDILNPLDRRYPGTADIRYLRLPVTMTKVDYYIDNWNLSGIIINEPRFDKYPVYNGEFYPGSTAPYPLIEPDIGIDSQQFGLALNGIFSGWDLSLYTAYVYEDTPHVVNDLVNDTYRTYDQSLMFGVAGNIALGNWLIKGEGAWWEGLTYSTIDENKSRLDILAGIEYTGFTETTVSLEVANRHIFGFDERLENLPDGQNEDWVQYALRYVRDFYNDTMRLTVVISSYGLLGADGGYERFQLDYDLTDNITLTGGVVFYESGDHPGFADIGDNDRLLVEFEYRF